MKKLLAISLCFVYFFAAAGVSINVHYCGGEVEEVSFFATEGKGCCCGDETETSCCQDEISYIKLNDSHQQAASLTLPSCSTSWTDACETPLALQFSIDSKKAVHIDISPHGPPLQAKVPVFLKFQHLLI